MMFSTFQRALTPNAGQGESRDLSALTLDSSPAAPGLLMRDPSPPPFSPLEPSEDDIPPGTGQATTHNDLIISAQQELTMDIVPGHSLPDRKQDYTDDSLRGPAGASDATSMPYHGSFLLDGASDNHLPPTLEGAHARGSPQPSVETTLFTSKSHQTQRPPTPSENHTGVGSRVSSPPQSSKNVTGMLQSTGSPLSSIEPVQSTSKAQPAPQFPTHNENQAGLEPEGSNPSQPSAMTTKKSRGTALHPPRAKRVSTNLETPYVQPEQSVPEKADDPHISTSKARPPKRKRGEDPPGTETKSAKKRRSQPREEKVSPAAVKPRAVTKDNSSKRGGRSKKEKGYTGNVKQQGAAKDEAPKQRGRPKKDEGSIANFKQQGVLKDKVSKKRGRPEKEEGPPHSVKSQRVAKEDAPAKRGRPKEGGPRQDGKSQRVSKEDAPAKRGRPKKDEGPRQNGKAQRVSKEDTPAKRGRPKKETAPQTAKTEKPKEQNRGGTEMPKKRGRPAKEAEPTWAVESASVPTLDTPKKRGKPNKGNEAAQRTETQITSSSNTPKKRGRTKKMEDIPEATEPQDPSNVESTKKRGRSKATGQDETAKTAAPGKRGRPKKK